MQPFKVEIYNITKYQTTRIILLSFSVLSHHTGSLSVQGQIYLMLDCTTGLVMVTWNNTFECAQYLETILVRPGDLLMNGRTTVLLHTPVIRHRYHTIYYSRNMAHLRLA